MAEVRLRMTAIRGYLYHDVNTKLSPAVTKLMKGGQPLDLFAADVSSVLPPVRSVAALLKASRLLTTSPLAPTVFPLGLAISPSKLHKIGLSVA